MKCLRMGSLFFLVAAFLLGGSTVLADTISVTNSNDGFGSSYTLTADCTGNLCNVTLQINASKAAYTDISNVDFKIGTTDTLTGTGSLTAPTADWSTVTSSLSSGGCKGSNSDGQICSTATGDFADTAGGMLTWTWTGVQVTGDLAIGHVGYKYDTSDTLGEGLIVSNDYPTNVTVPEPDTLGLLTIGILGLVVVRKLA